MADPAQYMQDHFEDLGNLESDFRNKNLNNFVVSSLVPGSFIDIGCGVGHILNRAKEKGRKEVYGAEPDKKLIEISKKIYNKDLQIQPYGALEIHKYKKKFDNITMVDVLEHIEDDEGVLTYLRSHITDTGQLIINVPAYQYLFNDRDTELGHFRRYNAENLKAKLERNGYEILELRYWNMLGFFVVLFYTKILKKKPEIKLRKNVSRGPIATIINKLLHVWMRLIENTLNLGWGLSVFCRARPIRT